MAIALDAVSFATAATGTATRTWSHTCAGSDRVLVVGTMGRDVSSVTELPVVVLTYNGVALTKIRHDETAGDNYRTELWRLVAPATGTHDIFLETDGTASDLLAAGAISLTGVDQVTPVDAHNGSISAVNVDAASDDVITTADGAWIVDVLLNGDGVAGTLVAGAGQTEFAVQENVGNFAEAVGMSYEGPKTPAGAATMSWTWTTSNRYTHSAAAFKPVQIPPIEMGQRMYVMP